MFKKRNKNPDIAIGIFFAECKGHTIIPFTNLYPKLAIKSVSTSDHPLTYTVKFNEKSVINLSLAVYEIGRAIDVIYGQNESK